jgi:MFS family permease
MNRSLQRLVLSHGLSAAAMAMPWPALLAVTWSTTHSGAMLGLVGAARMAPYVVLSWASGALGDRVRRSVLVRVTTRLRALLLALAALALKFDHLTTAVVIATLVVAVGTPAYPALAAAMPATAKTLTETATSWLVTFEVGAFVVGPAIGGLALSLAGAHASMLIAAGTAVFASMLIAGVAVSESAQDNADQRAGRPLAVVARCPDAVRVIATVAIVNVVIGAVAVALLPLVERSWHSGEHEFGLLTAAFGFGALAAPGVRRLIGLAPSAVRISLALVGLPLLLVAASPDWAWAMAPLLLLGAAATQVECMATSILQQSVPDNVRAFAFGVADTVMVMGALVGATTAPWLAETLGTRLVFVLFAVLTVGLVVAAPQGRRIEPRPTSQAVVHVTSVS